MTAESSFTSSGCVLEAAVAADLPGFVLLDATNNDGELEISWGLHPDAWHRGLATLMARTVIDDA